MDAGPGYCGSNHPNFVISMSFDRDQGYPAQPERRQLPRAAATRRIAAGGCTGRRGMRLRFAFAPAAFDVHDDRALIWLSANQVSRLHVRWGTKPDALDQRSAEVELNATMDYTGHVALTGLLRARRSTTAPWRQCGQRDRRFNSRRARPGRT